MAAAPTAQAKGGPLGSLGPNPYAVARVDVPRSALSCFEQPEVHMSIETASRILGFAGEKELRRFVAPLLKQTDEEPLGTHVGALGFKRLVGLCASKNVAARKLFEEFMVGTDFVSLPANTIAASGAVPRWASCVPESVGMDRAPFDRLQQYFNWRTKMRHFAGIACGVVKNGMLVYYQESGYSNVEAKVKMTGDTLVRLFSMTKCLVAAAFMTYLEDQSLGIDLDDPVSKYIPAFAQSAMSVLPKRGQKENQPLERPITLRQLLTHTSGIGYGATLDDPWPPQKGSYYKIYEELCEKTKDGRIANLEEWCNYLAKVPLKGQPGHFWDYSYSLDVMGRVLEVLASKPLDQVLEERICGPLKMRDTTFAVKPEDAHRIGPWYKSVEVEGKSNSAHVLEVVDKGGVESGWVGDNVSKVYSGGGTVEVPLVMKGGMVSTFNDYLRFLMMIRNFGELDGVRILKKETIQNMICNHIPAACNGKRTVFVFDKPGVGYSCLGQIQSLHPKQDKGTCSGEFGWGGLAGPAWTIDPRSDMIVLSMTQTAFVLDHEEYLRYAARRAIHQHIYGSVAAASKATSYPPEMFDLIKVKVAKDDSASMDKEFEEEHRITKLTRSKTAKERAILPGARLDRHPSEEVESNTSGDVLLMPQEAEATPAAKRRRSSMPAGVSPATPAGLAGLEPQTPATNSKGQGSARRPAPSGLLPPATAAGSSPPPKGASPSAGGASAVASPAPKGASPQAMDVSPTNAKTGGAGSVAPSPGRLPDPSKPEELRFSRVLVPGLPEDGGVAEGTLQKARVTNVDGESVEVITEGSWATRSVRMGDLSVIDESHFTVSTAIQKDDPTEFPMPGLPRPGGNSNPNDST